MARSDGGADRTRHRTVGASEDNVQFARKLRKDMSLPEVLLWQQLRKRPAGIRYRRQFPIAGYVLDFACLERRLAIEIDGSAHDYGDRPERDARRDNDLSELGFDTLRIAARDVLTNLDAVLLHIIQYCSNRPLRQRCALPPPRSGEESGKLS